MPRYKLRTLLIVVAVEPVIIWAASMFWMAVVAPAIWALMFGEPPPLSHYGGGPTAVEHPYPELFDEPSLETEATP